MRLPPRYTRNSGVISSEQQGVLAAKHVLVAGCGGLGGQVIEELLRLGIGTITALDPDTFDETNLNRQLLATESVVGQAKADVAALRASEVNSGVTFRAHQIRIDATNARSFCEGADLVIDALDNAADRLILAAGARQAGVPLVHGAVAGWHGQVCTVYPGDSTLERLYPGERGTEPSNAAFAPAVVAGLQVAEALKVLLGYPRGSGNRVLFIDLLRQRFDLVEV